MLRNIFMIVFQPAFWLFTGAAHNQIHFIAMRCKKKKKKSGLTASVPAH